MFIKNKKINFVVFGYNVIYIYNFENEKNKKFIKNNINHIYI